MRITRLWSVHAVIPLAPRTSRAVDFYISARTTSPILLGVKGEHIDRYAADRTVKCLARRATSPSGSVLTACDSFVTAALDAGVALRDIQEAASHADPRTTTRDDRGRGSLDRHATFIVVTFLPGTAR